MRARAAVAALLLSLGVTSSAHTDPVVSPFCAPGSGFCAALLIVPEDRFNPLIQQLMLRDQLRPTAFLPLFHPYPEGIDERLVEMQIQYLQQLLEARRASAGEE